MTEPRWRILKFGGGSTASVEDWETLAEIVRARIGEGVRPFLVLGARRAVTRRLSTAIDRAMEGILGDELEDLRADHLELARALRSDLDAAAFDATLEPVRRALGRIAETGAAPPATRASILAAGERLSTTVAAAFLKSLGLGVTELDATEILMSDEAEPASAARRYLRAECRAEPDPSLIRSLARLDSDVVLTQGFAASSPAGETVLLGWGGSDTSAACFGVKLEADRVELWKNVPGFFTADPRLAPSARLLRRLDYDEAEEMARAGAEIVHPRALGPLRAARIPLEIRSIHDPGGEYGTVGDQTVRGAQVKAIAARSGVTLLSVDTPRMWQEVGFLARLFTTLSRHDLSVDLVATSETNVTVSIDPIHDLDPDAIDRAVEDLRGFCDARTIHPCSVVSLIGRDLRSMLPDLAPALEVLDEQRVHLLSQSASDLDFAFVIDQPHTDRLVQRLHAAFFDHQPEDEIFGPSWSALTRTDVQETGPPEQGSDAMARWWIERRDELLEIVAEASPVYVYDESTLRRQVGRLAELETIDRIFYATKANWNRDVLRTFHEMGIGFECVSPGEIAHVRAVLPDLDRTRILFTPNFAPRSDYEEAFEQGTWVTLDNLHPLAEWPGVFRGRSILIRIDPGQGHGHHKHVRTAGVQSKFGIAPSELPRVAELAAKHDVQIVGLHAHVGSGVKIAEAWIHTARTLATHLELFPSVRIINMGGGLGVVERPGDPPLDLAEMGRSLASFREEHDQLELWLEPGRFLVAEAGVLLTTVTQLKTKGPVRYVGVDTGFNSLLRPALYGAHHEIVNLSRYGASPEIVAEVVGPICETGDVLGHGRALPRTVEGDRLLIATAGAYGRVMASEYNRRPPAGERFLPSR